MTISYVPNRMQILSARALQIALQRLGEPVPEHIRDEAAWDLDEAVDSRPISR